MKPNSPHVYDYIVIGGGIVGISTAWQLQRRFPDKKVLLLEKEAGLSRHQTGHNSGVIHAGVYYAPGSLKARFCKTGNQEMTAFCQKNKIAFKNCGKLLVAISSIELRRMGDLLERCRRNAIEVEPLDNHQLKKREPNITGLGGLYVPGTSIVDFQQVTETMADRFRRRGGRLLLRHAVVDIVESGEAVSVTAEAASSFQTFTGRYLIACAGLLADRIAKLSGIRTDFQVIPFRGEYYRLASRHNQVVRHLIYPIPDPDLPFLGVHLTRMVDGSVTVGPNAVLGWKREGYGRLNVSVRDILDMAAFPGSWKLLRSIFKAGLAEMKNSLWKPGYLRLVRKYCPQIKLDDLRPYPAGIRAQAVMKDGALVHDFLFAQTPRSLHVCNAPSPAATSSIPIGGYICDKAVPNN